jgi:hypothetical protein
MIGIVVLISFCFGKWFYTPIVDKEKGSKEKARVVKVLLN